MRFSVLGFRSDLRIELQAPVIILTHTSNVSINFIRKRGIVESVLRSQFMALRRSPNLVMIKKNDLLKKYCFHIYK